MRLLDFTASWCKPCTSQKSIVDSWSKVHPEVKVEVISVEDPNGAAIAAQFMVQSMPTLAFLSDSGQPLAVQPGLHDARRLDALYEQAKRR